MAFIASGDSFGRKDFYQRFFSKWIDHWLVPILSALILYDPS